MIEKFIRYRALFIVPGDARRGFAMLARQRLVAAQEFRNLQRVIGKRFGRGIYRGQAAPDYHDGQANLHVRDRIRFCRTRQLQRHQEIRCSAHAARKPVRQVQHGRPAGAQRQRDMVKTHVECVIRRERAAEAHSAEQSELPAPLDEQAHHLEKVLVPANGNAVFSNPAEAGHNAFIKRLVQLAHIAYRFKRDAPAARVHAGNMRGQRLDLQAVDADDRMAVVHQEVRE